MKDLTIKTATLSKVFFREIIANKQLPRDLYYRSKQIPGFNAFWGEIFHRFYYEVEPKYLEKIAPEHRYARKLHEQSLGLENLEQLANKTQGKIDLSMIASKQLVRQLLNYLEKPEFQNPEPLRQEVMKLKQNLKKKQTELQTGKNKEGLEQQIEQLEQRIKAVQEQGKEAVKGAIEYAECLNATEVIEDAVDEAETSIDDYIDAQSILGMSANGWDNSASSNQQVPIEEKVKLAEMLANSRQLKKILDLAGRMKDSFARKLRDKSTTGFNELVGITRGNDLARVTPGELIKLAEPETENLFYASYLQQSLMQYEIKGKQPKETGPIILCIDDSGSMSNWEAFSKALGITLATEATKAGRDVWVYMFDTVTEKYHFRGGYSEDILQLIGHKFRGGGTDFDVPLREALKLIEDDSKADKADIIFISDGECDLLNKDMLKDKKCQVFGLLTGRGRGMIFCDKVYQIKSVKDLDKLFIELV